MARKQGKQGKQFLTPGKRTHPLIWAAALTCAFLAIMVIITGIVVFAIYIIYQPKMPYLRVPYAHMNKLEYDQSGLLTVEMAINIEADNDNRKANASFSDISFILKFQGHEIAELAAEPFEVAKNSSVTLHYEVPSSPIPLDEQAMSEIDASLHMDMVRFELDGQARTRWRVGLFLSVKFWTHLSCRLQFSASNMSSLGLDCSSKAH